MNPAEGPDPEAQEKEDAKYGESEEAKSERELRRQQEAAMGESARAKFESGQRLTTGEKDELIRFVRNSEMTEEEKKAYLDKIFGGGK